LNTGSQMNNNSNNNNIKIKNILWIKNFVIKIKSN
jgi:hypothetical protein